MIVYVIIENEQVIGVADSMENAVQCVHMTYRQYHRHEFLLYEGVSRIELSTKKIGDPNYEWFADVYIVPKHVIEMPRHL